jgi:hypothetical protein
VSGASWQSRTAVSLLIGAAAEGLCALLAVEVSTAFGLVTLVVAVVIGWRLGPVFGGIGAGFPPVGLALVPSDDYVGQRIFSALAVVLLLGGSAWMTGRVRERYGHPPWGHSSRASE